MYLRTYLSTIQFADGHIESRQNQECAVSEAFLTSPDGISARIRSELAPCDVCINTEVLHTREIPDE